MTSCSEFKQVTKGKEKWYHWSLTDELPICQYSFIEKAGNSFANITEKLLHQLWPTAPMFCL